MADRKITLLFWNVQGRNVTQSVARLAQRYGANIIFLAEAEVQRDTDGLLNMLNQPPRLPSEREFARIAWALEPKTNTAMAHLQAVSNLPSTAWTEQVVRNRYAVWTIKISETRSFHLAAVHFPGIQQDQGDGQRESAIALRRDLEDVEANQALTEKPESQGDRMSVIMGDFNANPFDPGLISVYGLNTTPSREIAGTQYRTSNGLRHKYLYSPMWRFLGAEPWGTYYNDSLSNPLRYNWNLLDQVLVSPDMVSYFDHEGKGDASDIQILTSDGIVEFDFSRRSTNAGMPDHRPLLFRFTLPASTAAVG